MFLNIVDESHKQLYLALDKRVKDLKRYEILLPKMLPKKDNHVYNLYYILIQAALFSDIGITIKELETCVGSSANTLRKMLNNIPWGLLIIDKTYREYHYYIDITELDRRLSGSDMSG